MAGGTHFAVCVVSRAMASPFTKILSPDLIPENIVETSGFWIKDGIKDIKGGFQDRIPLHSIIGICNDYRFLLVLYIFERQMIENNWRNITWRNY